MAECSARPDNLASFDPLSAALDGDIKSARSSLASAYASFQANNKWGSLVVMQT